MSKSQSIDSKREEFRKFLESCGIMDTFTRILTMIYENEEKPADPLQFVREQFIKSSPDIVEFESMQKYLEKAKQKISELERENVLLKKELDDCQAKTNNRQSEE